MCFWSSYGFEMAFLCVLLSVCAPVTEQFRPAHKFLLPVRPSMLSGALRQSFARVSSGSGCLSAASRAAGGQATRVE